MLDSGMGPFRCPACHRKLQIQQDFLECGGCAVKYPVVDGIPRFVPAENYAASFGFQWNLHAKTQLDAYNGLTISRDRFFSETGWASEELRNHTVLECGSGAGRFSQVIADCGALLFTIDYSDAIDANAKNNLEKKNISYAQASIYSLPFEKDYFDYLVCLGVLQHTPNVELSIKSMVSHLKPGGRFCFDVYASPISYLHPRHLLRPITKRMDKQVLYRRICTWVPWLLPISTALHRVPIAGEYLARLIPVANWRKNIALPNEEVYREWAVLDTFDWLSPAYEQPQSKRKLSHVVAQLPLEDVEIFGVRGLYVVRGRKSASGNGESSSQ